MPSGPLLDAPTLRRMLDAPDSARPVLLDVRYRLGRDTGYEEYLAAHLPGAAYIDLTTALAAIAPDGRGGRHPMPDPGRFAAAMRAAGVWMDRPVVAYDDWSSLPASRAWWLLRYFGKPDGYVLDGGIGAWRRSGGEMAAGATAREPGDFTVSVGREDDLLDADGAARLAREGLLLDARPADRFRGENESVDPVAGHIPGARSAPALADVDGEGRFLAPFTLARQIGMVQIGTDQISTDPVRGVGTYCGSGIQATHLALALEIAGYPPARVYIGSWSDWIGDPHRPVQQGR